MTKNEWIGAAVGGAFALFIGLLLFQNYGLGDFLAACCFVGLGILLGGFFDE